MPCFTLPTIKSKVQPTWCPGCGNFLIINSLQKAISDLQINEEELILVYGIGCSGNMADFNKSYGFHGLHGRGIANAIGMKMANHKMKIIVIGGDGDLYGEGLAHFIAAARGNHDITVLAHNNSRYSLTTGQTAPTTKKGTKTKSTPMGSIEAPLNPLMMALSANASFVARSYSTKPLEMTQVITEAIQHPGFALVDVMQLCPTFNKTENHPWFAERIYDLAEAGHNSEDKTAAINKAIESEKIGLGVLYQDKSSHPYHQQVARLQSDALINQWSNERNIEKALSKFE